MYTLQFVMVGVFRGIRSKRPFQTPDKTFFDCCRNQSLFACYLCFIFLSCTKYQDYFKNIASQTVTDVLGSK